MKTFKSIAIGCMAVLSLPAIALAQPFPGAVRIGVMSDSSSLYAAIGGPGSVVAAKMAVEDFGGSVLGKPIDVIAADHQNKVDVASAIARRWVDEMGVTAFADVATSSTALAVQALEKERQRAVVLISGGGARALGDEACSPVGVLWAWNTYSMAAGTANAAVKQGYKKWFMLAADYAFGKALAGDATKVIEANGGEVIATVRHPLNTSDFSSFLVQAQQSGADILGLANAGGDTVNAIKQAGEFGLKKAGNQVGGASRVHYRRSLARPRASARPAAYHAFLLKSYVGNARLVDAFFQDTRRYANDCPSGRVFECHALSKGR